MSISVCIWCIQSTNGYLESVITEALSSIKSEVTVDGELKIIKPKINYQFKCGKIDHDKPIKDWTIYKSSGEQINKLLEDRWKETPIGLAKQEEAKNIKMEIILRQHQRDAEYKARQIKEHQRYMAEEKARIAKEDYEKLKELDYKCKTDSEWRKQEAQQEYARQKNLMSEYKQNYYTMSPCQGQICQGRNAECVVDTQCPDCRFRNGSVPEPNRKPSVASVSVPSAPSAFAPSAFAPSAFASSAFVPSTKNCRICTYSNEISRNYCSMCGTKL